MKKKYLPFGAIMSMGIHIADAIKWIEIDITLEISLDIRCHKGIISLNQSGVNNIGYNYWR